MTGHRRVQICGEWAEAFSGPNENPDVREETETSRKSLSPSKVKVDPEWI